jgi:hypothetical protein
VKRWSSGEMALRWPAAGMLEAELLDADHMPSEQAAFVATV